MPIEWKPVAEWQGTKEPRYAQAAAYLLCQKSKIGNYYVMILGYWDMADLCWRNDNDGKFEPTHYARITNPE